jgi:F-type H+-transporting ATPase subunit a
VPGRGQFIGEMVYGGVRNGIARDVIGREFAAYVPLLVTLFTFILVNNLFGIVPFFQFPTMSRVGFPIGLGLVVWVLYNAVGIRRHGLGGYLKQMTLPPGVPLWVLFLLAPIEFFSTVVVRPLTLSVRLFANMFAGHLLLLVFIGGGAYMLHHGPVFVRAAGPLSMAFAIVLSFFEMFIEFLQAFIFTLLVALYISGALAEEH